MGGKYIRHEFKNCLKILRDTNNFRSVGVNMKMPLKQILDKWGGTVGIGGDKERR
jgi:hypothetical protein